MTEKIMTLAELTEILRDIIAASDANDHGSLMNAIEAAKEALSRRDAIDRQKTARRPRR